MVKEFQRLVSKKDVQTIQEMGAAILARRLARNAEYRREREPEYDGPRVKEAKSVTAPLTHQCPSCHHMVNTIDTYGYKRDDRGVDNVKEIPCEVCSLPVKRYQRSKQATAYMRRIQSRLTQVSPKERGYTFQSYIKLGGDKKAIQLMKEFVASDDMNLFLWGSSGKGKTGLVISAFRELAEAGVQVLFLKADRYLDLLKENFESPDSNHIEDITRGVTVLALDDFGVGKFSEFAIAELEKLIEDRASLGLRTAITSNFGLDQLTNIMALDKFKGGFQPAERITSRLYKYERHEITGSDLRRRG